MQIDPFEREFSQSQQNGGGGGGGKGPWGSGPQPSGSTPPDLEEFLRRSQDKLRSVLGQRTGREQGEHGDESDDREQRPQH